MEIFTVIAIALALAMDAFSVSIASAASYKRLHIVHGLRMALVFGVFQGVMPIIGFVMGEGFESFIEPFNHWLAFILLLVIGVKMIAESFEMREDKDIMSVKILLLLGVATSIDALGVGFTLSLVTEHIIAAVVIIGIITFLLCAAGYYIGRKMGHFFESKIEIFGGVVLIAIGCRILFQHFSQ